MNRYRIILVLCIFQLIISGICHSLTDCEKERFRFYYRLYMLTNFDSSSNKFFNSFLAHGKDAIDFYESEFYRENDMSVKMAYIENLSLFLDQKVYAKAAYYRLYNNILTLPIKKKIPLLNQWLMVFGRLGDFEHFNIIDESLKNQELYCNALIGAKYLNSASVVNLMRERIKENISKIGGLREVNNNKSNYELATWLRILNSNNIGILEGKFKITKQQKLKLKIENLRKYNFGICWGNEIIEFLKEELGY